MPAVLDDISAEILDLKKKIGATILAHYYQEGEIQASRRRHRRQPQAGPRGDQGRFARHRLLRRPLHGRDGQDAQPVEEGAACPTFRPGAASSTPAPPTSSPAYQEMLRINGRKFQTVTYINSSAKVKALSDWVVTSGNAEDVVRNKVPPGYEILFVPDKHLGCVPQGGDRPRHDPVGRVVHGPRDLQPRRPAEDEEAAPAGEDDRPPGVPREHPRTRGLRRRHRGDGQARRGRTRSRPSSWWRPRRT